MSIEVMTRVWADSKQSGSHLLIMLSIADNANDQGVAWPAVATIAKKTRTTDRWVRMALQKLVADKEISVETGAGWKGVNIYHFAPQFCKRKGGAEVTSGGLQCSGEGAEYGGHTPEDGAKNVLPCSAKSSEPSKESPKKKARKTAPAVFNLSEFMEGLGITGLEGTQFEDAWKEWEAHLCAKGSRCRPTEGSRKYQLLKLSRLGTVEIAVKEIERAIEHNWQGIFPESENKRNGHTRPGHRGPSSPPAAFDILEGGGGMGGASELEANGHEAGDDLAPRPGDPDYVEPNGVAHIYRPREGA